MTDFAPVAVSCDYLKPGDFAVFDSFYGVERVVQNNDAGTDNTGVAIRYLETAYVLPGTPDTRWGRAKPAEEQHRFFRRGGFESVVRWQEATR